MKYSTFIITVKVPDAGAPATIRLRNMLKTMLRTFGIVCLDVAETGQHVTAKPLQEAAND
jgi:hypothetical protein